MNMEILVDATFQKGRIIHPNARNMMEKLNIFSVAKGSGATLPQIAPPH